MIKGKMFIVYLFTHTDIDSWIIKLIYLKP
jgi:hypothetical protein